MILLFYGFNISSFESYVFGFNSCQEFKEIIYANIRYLFVIANPTHRVSSLAQKVK